MPKTVEAKLLLGWMSKPEALDFLLGKCAFEHPLAEPEALAMWRKYQDKVAALGKRVCTIPESQPLGLREKMEIKKFKKNPPRMQLDEVFPGSVLPAQAAFYELGISIQAVVVPNCQMWRRPGPSCCRNCHRCHDCFLSPASTYENENCG